MTFKQLCIIMSTFFLLFLSCCRSQQIFESGIHTLIIDRNNSHRNLEYTSLEFKMNFGRHYSDRPIAIIAPLLILRDKYLESEDLMFEMKIELQIVSIRDKQIDVLVKRSSINNIIYLKVSYLFMDQSVSQSYGLLMLNSKQLQQKSLLKADKGDYLKIHQIIDDSLKRKENFKKTSALYPYDYRKCKFFLFMNEFLFKQNQHISYNLSLNTKETHIELLFISNLDNQMYFPSYSILLFSENQQQNNIIFQKVSIVIPNQLFSSIVSHSKCLLMGITGYSAENSIQMMNIDFSKASDHFFIRKGQKTQEKIQININILALPSDEQYDEDKQYYTSRLLLTCTSPTYLTTFIDYWTTWQLPVNTSLQTCQPCPTGCYSCYHCNSCLHYVNCSMCLSGFDLVKLNVNTYPNSQRVCTCPSGLFPDAVVKTCLACSAIIPNCASCVTENSGHFGVTCATCGNRYFGSAPSTATNGFTTCSPCTFGCTTCTSATNCSSCVSGFTLSAGTCVCSTAGTYYNSATLSCQKCATIYPNCATCVQVGSVTSCSTCVSSFYLSSNGSCAACSVYCLSCTNTTCLNCMPTFMIAGSSCVCSTSPQMLLNTGTSTCISCTSSIPLCSLCSISGGSITCTTCSPGSFFSTPTSCIACPSLCTTCTSLTYCQSCLNNLAILSNNLCGCDLASGFYLNALTNTCASCSQTFPQCTACITSPSFACSTCAAKTFLSGGSCLACPIQCATCTSLAVCQSCIPGYTLNTGTNLCDCTGCTNCNTNGVANCALCDITNPLNKFCVTCMPGYFLSSGSCSACPQICTTCTTLTSCQTCRSPFIQSSPPGSCLCNSLALLYYNPSGPTCSSCTSIPGIAATCISCQSAGNVTSCIACSTGNYVVNGTCAACPFPCTTCTAANNCSTCAATFILIGATCTCDTAHQIFLNTAPNPDVCSSCTTITSPLCLTCSYNVLAVSGVACTSCQSGYFPNPVTYLCSACPLTCPKCSSLTSCTQCLDTYRLINGTCRCDTANQIFLYGGICLPCYSIINHCINCTNSTGTVLCAGCSPGTHVSADGSTCIRCQLNCEVCDYLGCSACNDGYSLDMNGICDCANPCRTNSSIDSSCVTCEVYPHPITNISTLFCTSCLMRTFLYQKKNCNSCPTYCSTCSNYLTCLTCQPSFTLINKNCECNAAANDILVGSVCKNCVELVTGCQTCTLVATIAKCTLCFPGWGLDIISGLCHICVRGCKACTISAGIVTGCVSCYPFYTLSSGACTPSHACNTSARLYYDSTFTICRTCMANCLICYDSLSCVKCSPSFSYLKNKCVCNNGLNKFQDSTALGTCIDCQSAQAGGPGGSLYLANCKYCQQSADYYWNNIECQQCLDGFYVDSGSCSPCMNGCQKCSSPYCCCSCSPPLWIMNGGLCSCNNALNYFFDGNSQCLLCSIANCTVCSNITTCLVCNYDSFMNSSGMCQLSICGNGLVQGNQQCDDANTVAGDGCSSNCQVEQFYYCVNTPSPSICAIDSRFKIKLIEMFAQCNVITFKFKIYPYHSYYDQANFDKFIYRNSLNTTTTLISFNKSYDILSYKYFFNTSIQSSIATFIFDPSDLQINQTLGYPTNTLTFPIDPTNNVLAFHYNQSVCHTTATLKKLTDFIEYGSYAFMVVSLLPAKIVGLEMVGVIQLAFFSLGSMDYVNIMMTPMMGMKGINGFAVNMGKQPSKKRLLQTDTLTPERINSIGYNANFLRNCNVMLFLILAVIFVASSFYILTYLIRNCAESLHKIAKRLTKEVLLTIILFNCFNVAYSAGIHFRYATREDSLYVWGTLAAVFSLILSILMTIALSITQNEGFGQYKDKLKPDCIEKAYFVITIIYRMGLGLYMSSQNEDQLSTLIALGISILFLLYNLVNLPFAKTYHNYRANICHLCQFIILFVTMYFRSMTSNMSKAEIANIYTPVYIEYACMMVSFLISLFVLIYDIYVWIKECCQEKKEKTDDLIMIQRRVSHINEIDSHLNPSLKSLANQEKEAKINAEADEISEIYI